jgi:ribonuclease R
LNSFAYPIPSREEILSVFRAHTTALGIHKIASALGISTKKIEGLLRRLVAMERDGQILLNKQGNYQLEKEDQFILGTVSAHRDGYGFLLPDSPTQSEVDIFLPEKELQKVMHGDRVKAKITGTDRKGKPEGKIIEIVERANTHMIGRLYSKNKTWCVIPEDNRINHPIEIHGNLNKAKEGQVVTVEILQHPSKYSAATGKIIEVLGEIDDPGMEIEIAVRKFNVPHVFSPATLKLADKLPSEVQTKDLKDRVDLRDIPFITIDGEDARDFDDAVYCEPIFENKKNKKQLQQFRLLVAIADVSHYVKPNDALDKDALLRSTSVYFPRRVIPMLPEKLSNGLCSLNPDVDRLTLVCDMVISLNGEISAYQFYPAVIHSARRMTYTKVAELLAKPELIQTENDLIILPHLLNLNAVFHALLDARHQRGAIDFETTETYIVSDERGKIQQILPRTRNDAHRLIEECMLAANVCAADLLQTHKHPGVYRIHAAPSSEKLTQIRTYLRQVGLFLGGGENPQASDYTEIINKIKMRPDAELLQTMLLRSMQQAVYSPENIGHFGLAYDAYAHFTSPIRRYPDLLTHRAIKAILEGKRYTPKDIDTTLLNSAPTQRNKKPAASSEIKKPKKSSASQQIAIWEALGTHCSANERRADEASRDVEAWLKCYFMQNKIGEEFTGTISGVTSFGIFVQLDELFVEGLVHITELGSDYLRYDETRHELRNDRTQQRYQLTNKVKVTIAHVDMESRKIDLRLANAVSRSRAPHTPTPTKKFSNREQNKKELRSQKQSNKSEKQTHDAKPNKSRKSNKPTESGKPNQSKKKKR